MKSKDQLPYLEWTEPDSGEVRRLYSDVVTQEQAGMPASVTEHAVEVGANITDHYRKGNEVVSTVMFFSGSPLRGDLDVDNPGTINPVPLTYPKSRATGAPIFTPGGIAQAGGGALSSLLGLGPPALPQAIQALTFAEAPKLFDKTIDTVRRLQASGILVTVKLSFGTPIENCGIINAQPSRDPDDGSSGKISFDFQQLNFAESDVALGLPLPAEPRGQNKGGAGTAGGAKVDPNSGKGSALKKLTDAAGITDAGSGT